MHISEGWKGGGGWTVKNYVLFNFYDFRIFHTIYLKLHKNLFENVNFSILCRKFSPSTKRWASFSGPSIENPPHCWGGGKSENNKILNATKNDRTMWGNWIFVHTLPGSSKALEGNILGEIKIEWLKKTKVFLFFFASSPPSIFGYHKMIGEKVRHCCCCERGNLSLIAFHSFFFFFVKEGKREKGGGSLSRFEDQDFDSDSKHLSQNGKANRFW